MHAFVDRGLPFIPPQPIELVPNGQDVTLRCRAGALVDGTVTLPDGKPAKGAMVFLMCENQTYTAITSADGSFQCAVPDVPGEVWTYLLVEGKPRFSTNRQAYRPGAGTVELKLKAIN